MNPITISKWQAKFLENAASVFSGKALQKMEDTPEVERLYAQIGQLKVELDFFKRKCKEIGNTSARMETVKRDHPGLSVRKQCDLQMIPRSSLYYDPIPEKPENQKMMNLMDKHPTLHHTEGVVFMLDFVKEREYCVGPKRICRSFRLMGSDHLPQEEPYKRSIKGV